MFLGEVVGTCLLVLLGDGVVAGVLLNKSKAQNSGWVVITWAWGMAVLVGVFGSLAVGGGLAHLNPAVTLGLAAIGPEKFGFTWGDVPTIIAGEFVGAFLGATLVWLAYLVHWSETEDTGLKLAVFCTGPAIRNTAANLITEIIGTAVLLFGILALPARVPDGPRGGAAGRRHRHVARRTDRLRDQPGARPRAADHALHPADPR